MASTLSFQDVAGGGRGGGRGRGRGGEGGDTCQVKDGVDASKGRGGEGEREGKRGKEKARRVGGWRERQDQRDAIHGLENGVNEHKLQCRYKSFRHHPATLTFALAAEHYLAPRRAHSPEQRVPSGDRLERRALDVF